MRFLPICAVVAVLNLTACARHPPPAAGPAPGSEPSPVPAQSPPAATAPHHKPHPSASTPGASAPTAPPAPIVLTGLTREQTSAMLGEPAARADRNPGEQWIYRAPGCEVEVLFLLDLERNDYFAVDSHIAAGTNSPDGEQACLRRIKHDHDK